MKEFLPDKKPEECNERQPKKKSVLETLIPANEERTDERECEARYNGV